MLNFPGRQFNELLGRIGELSMHAMQLHLFFLPYIL